ncbi:MAG TPA: MFS transporter [Ligilactobacillus acidipiscis]|uniref:MFS transporter n=1 Tax=Ligilactobacillus acidipiscis TaxID=89059 RepID=A0A921K0Y4_9LACO|nr:MFS transporter [Ligilactobacillus acidipiscis]
MEISLHESNQQIFKDICSNFISSLSSNMFTYGLGLMLLNQTHSALSFGIELAIGPIISLIFMIPIGNLVDKYPHKRILLASMLIRVVFLLFLAVTLNYFVGMLKFIPVIFFVSVNSIAVIFDTTAYSASVHELVNENKIHQLSSLTSAANSFANIFAPVLGVGAYSLLGFQFFVWIEIGALLLSAAITVTMKFHYKNTYISKNVIQQKSQLVNFKKGLDYITQRPLIKALIAIAMLLNFMFSSVNMGLPYIINTQLHLGNSPIGILDTFNAAGGLLAALLMNFVPVNKAKRSRIIAPLFLFGFYFLSLGTIFSLTTDLKSVNILGSITMFIGGLGISVLNITIQIHIQKTTPTVILGRVSSTMNTANTVVFPIGTLFFTFIFQKISNGALVYLICGTIWLLVTSLMASRLNTIIDTDSDLV